MRTRLFNANIITEGEIESLINKLLNEIHQIHRMRTNEPLGADYERREQAAFLQLRVIEGLFPQSQHTRIRVKISYHRWGKTQNNTFNGIKVIYDKDDKGD
jgi:hypothetical protein